MNYRIAHRGRTSFWAIIAAAAIVASACNSAAASLSPSPAATASTGEPPSSATSSSATSSSAAANLNDLLPDSIRTAGVLKVLTDPEFNPISYYKSGSTSEIIGSDPDILRAMGSKLGIEVQFEPTSFTGMIPGVQSGRADLAGGGLTDTKVREDTVSFVDDFQLGELYVVKAGNAAGVSTDLLSVCGKKIAFTIGAQSATDVQHLSAKCTAAGKPAMQGVGVSDVNATLLSVRSGRVDVSFYDDLGFASVNKAANNELQAFKIADWPVQYWGFAVGKDNDKLAAALLSGLKAIIDDGTYASILKTYGLESNALTDPGVNLTTTR